MVDLKENGEQSGLIPPHLPCLARVQRLGPNLVPQRLDVPLQQTLMQLEPERFRLQRISAPRAKDY